MGRDKDKKDKKDPKYTVVVRGTDEKGRKYKDPVTPTDATDKEDAERQVRETLLDGEEITGTHHGNIGKPLPPAQG